MFISQDSLNKLVPDEILQSLKLSAAIKSAWTKDTAYPDDVNRWREDDPSIGQCAVTSLIVQDYLSGVIHRNSKFKHYWNELPSGGFVDFTREQFKTEEPIDSEGKTSRESLLRGERADRARTLVRYKALKKSTRQQLRRQEPTLFLFSSNAQAEYIHDIVETLGAPEGSIYHFRYMLRYLDPFLRKLIPSQGESTPRAFKNLKTIVMYLNQSKNVGGTYSWNATIPIRIALMKQCWKTGDADNSIAHFFFELQDGLLETNEYTQLLRDIFGKFYEKAYAFLTFEDISKLVKKHPASMIFETKCEKLKQVGLAFEKEGTKIEYEPPLMILIEGLYRRNLWGKSVIVKPKYDTFVPKSYYKLRESKSYYFRFRTYNWDFKKQYEIALKLPKDLFCTPEEYLLPINSAYYSECWELIPAFTEQNTSGYMTLEVKAKEATASSQTAAKELNWKIFTIIDIKRRISLRIFDTLSDLLFVFGPVYIAATKLFENVTPKPWWIESWASILLGVYTTWFIIKLIRRFIGGI